jgi:1-acyl-sn-glycerol-3-phosphate acyltransferase
MLVPLRQHFLCWTFCAVYIPAAVLLSALTFGSTHDRARAWAIRNWGLVMLRICGITLTVEGQESLAQRKRRIMAFNHSSTLDIFVICAMLPDGGLPVTKKEILFVPFLGLGCYLMRFIILDRSNPERARRSMNRAAKRMREEELTVLIAPEGTRSGQREVQTFKTGACHLARIAKAPVVPCVIFGATDLFPIDRFYCKPGNIHVRVLAEISSADYTEDNAREKANQLQEIFATALADPPAAFA